MKFFPRRKAWWAVGLVAVLAVAALLVHNWQDDDDPVFDQAAKCGNIHFPSRPTVVWSRSDDSWNGDSAIRLVVDLSNSDLGGFEKLSALPPPVPGLPEGWLESRGKIKELADVIRSGKPEDFQHIDQDPPAAPYPTGVVLQRTGPEKTRVYIGINCF